MLWSKFLVEGPVGENACDRWHMTPDMLHLRVYKCLKHTDFYPCQKFLTLRKTFRFLHGNLFFMFFFNISLPYIYPFETQIMCFSAIYCANISKTEKLPADKNLYLECLWHITCDEWHLRGGGVKLLSQFHFPISFTLGVKVCWR